MYISLTNTYFVTNMIEVVPIHEQRHSCQGSDMENQQVQAPLTLLLSITSYLTQGL